MEDLNLSLVERLWSLEEVRVSSSDEETHIRKVGFALKTWRAQYKELKSQQNDKNGDIKDMKSDMYQLVGFFSVFQGVLFQGVTQLSTNACEFRYIPIALSVAATLGTIFGVSLKFSELLDIQERSNGYAISIKVLVSTFYFSSSYAKTVKVLRIDVVLSYLLHLPHAWHTCRYSFTISTKFCDKAKIFPFYLLQIPLQMILLL